MQPVGFLKSLNTVCERKGESCNTPKATAQVYLLFTQMGKLIFLVGGKEIRSTGSDMVSARTVRHANEGAQQAVEYTRQLD